MFNHARSSRFLVLQFTARLHTQLQLGNSWHISNQGLGMTNLTVLAAEHKTLQLKHGHLAVWGELSKPMCSVLTFGYPSDV
mmetsp:Transcript_18732/g.40284  ORF Transcript_18732/g.40284 Transcript_18732/m.40284 type:complete len:81 (+) Transcript_18732:790-1032(+)